MWPSRNSDAARVSSTTTSRWWRTSARSAKVATGKEPSSPSVQVSGLPVAWAAGLSMPIRASSRWASATCSSDSPRRVIGVPHFMIQPTYVENWPSIPKL